MLICDVENNHSTCARAVTLNVSPHGLVSSGPVILHSCNILFSSILGVMVEPVVVMDCIVIIDNITRIEENRINFLFIFLSFVSQIYNSNT